MTKLLFLDFDGVLHPNFSRASEYFNRVDILMGALGEEIQGLEVVVSSSWRFHYPIKEILSRLPNELKSLVVGFTPEVEPGRHQRYREIQTYLRLCRIGFDWRALDDAPSEFPDGCPQLIVCNGRVGVDHDSAAHLREWLRGRS
jgi:hypothetical protein